MYRAIPVINKACAERVREREHAKHKDRIKKMRPQVDTTEPHVVHLDHLRNNLKREQLLEERYHEIDRENRILLHKMSDIMRKTTGSVERAKSGPASMNRDARKADLMRITQENQRILHAIQRVQPVYNHIEWEDAHKRSNNYLKNTCEYPLVLKRKSSNRGGLLPLQNKDGTWPKMESATFPRSNGHPDRDLTKDDKAELRYVLKEGKQLGQKYYLVEMATDGRTLAISAYEGEQEKTLELLINERNHRKLYRDTNGDYNAIAAMLHVEGTQLIIDGLGDSSTADSAAAAAMASTV